MNTTPQEGLLLAKGVVEGSAQVPEDVTLIVAPPFTHLVQAAGLLEGSRVALSAQNCADHTSGAYTGEVSAPMLSASGCRYVILGHSERRQYYGETSEKLVVKLRLALAEGLVPILCVGENLDERNAGRHFEVVGAQVAEALFALEADEAIRCIVAYEPVWAIGTGVTATAAQAQEIHAFIRSAIEGYFGQEAAAHIPILYGGSCKPSNARELFSCPDIDGGLIGGAALKADDFIAIAQSF